MQCHPVVISRWLIRAQVRGRDDATVVVVRRRDGRDRRAPTTPATPRVRAGRARRQGGPGAALENELEETNRPAVVAMYAELDIQAQQLRQATELKSRFCRT